MINFHSIKFKTLIFMIIMLALVILLQTLYITPMLKKNSIKASAHSLENLADHFTENIDFLFQQARIELETIADLQSLKSMEKTQIDKTISEMKKVTRFFDYFFVLDNNENWVYYPHRFYEEGMDILNNGIRLFKENKPEETIFLDLIICEGHKLLGGFLTPIYSETNEQIGLLGGVIIFSEKSTLLSQIEKTKVGKNGYAYIVASNGFIIAHPRNRSDHHNIIFNDFMTDMPAEKALIKGKNLTEYEYGNKIWMAAYRPLKIKGWGTIIEQSKGNMIKKAQEEANLITKFFIMTIFLSFLFFIFILQYTLKPLARLVESIKSGNMISNRIYPKDEIGQLAHQFNKLYLNLFHANEALRESEERLYSIFNAANNIAFIMTDLSEKDALILDFSPGAEQIFGYKRQEVIGQSIIMLHMPEDSIHFSNIIKSIREGEKGITRETTLVRKSGEKFPALFTSYPILDSANNMIAVLGVSIDISNLKKAEEAFRKSEEKYRLLVENQTDLIVKVDLDGKFVFISPSYCELFGKKEGELLGKKFMPLVHEEDRTKTEKAMQTLYKPPYTAYIEQRALTKKGWRWLAWADKAVLDEKKNVLAVVGVGRDITERKKAEEELALTKTHLEYLLNTTPAVIYSYKVKDNSQLTYISENVSIQLGYTVKEIYEDPKFWIHHVHPKDKSKALSEAKNVIKNGSCVFEYRFLHKNGDYHWIRDERRLITDESKVDGEVVGSFYDITEQKHLQEQLYQAQKMEAIGTLAGGIAHDFNNLLQTISGYCELLEYNYKDHESLCKDIQKIKKASEKAASLTGKLLAFSRKQVIQPKIFDLNFVIADMEDMLRRIIGEDIELVIVLGQSLHAINADQSQIEQIIMNLVTNARDAMPNGGKLVLKTDQIIFDKSSRAKILHTKSNEFICLSVIDTGIGIEKKFINRIFEPFFSTKGLGKGTGLGLSMAYGIIKQHKGWIDVKSQPFQGTTFNIYLPASHKKAESEKKEKIIIKDIQGRGENILLVEDELEVREFVKRVLFENGYRVLDASCAKEAEHIFKQKKGDFHLVISDVVLPDETGLILVEKFHSYNPALLVLLCSGYSNHKAQLSQINKKGYQFIQKPYSITNLLKIMKEILNAQEKRSNDQHQEFLVHSPFSTDLSM